MKGFYGAKAETEHTINQLLQLPATGREQDWEYELADASRIGEMLNVYASASLDLDEKHALALLIISSMQDAFDEEILENSLIEKARELFFKDDLVSRSMYFYWVRIRRAKDSNFIKSFISNKPGRKA